MLIIEEIAKSIIRNKLRSMMVIIISFLIICFTGVYFGSIMQNKEMLNELGNRIPVNISITDSSGAKERGISISEKTLLHFLELDIVEPEFTAESYGNIGGNSNDTQRVSIYISSSNTFSAFSISYDEMTINRKTAEKIISGSDAECLIDLNYIEDRNLDIQSGDKLDINLFRAKYDKFGYAYEFVPVTSTEIKVAGFYRGSSQDENVPNMLCPIKWLEEQYKSAKESFVYTSASGIVCEPLQLNNLKERASELNFNHINVLADQYNKGIALCIDDRMYIQTASQITRSIQILKLFAIPVAFLMIFLIGTISFLVIRNRRREIYIARCLGKSKKQIIFGLIIENLFLGILGGTLAIFIMTIRRILEPEKCAYILVFFVCCQIVGVLVPAIVFGKVNLINYYTKTE